MTPTEVDAIAEEWADTMYQFALSTTGNHHDAEDIVQSAYVRLLESDGATLDTIEHVQAFIMQVIENTAMDASKRYSNRHAVPSGIMNDVPDKVSRDSALAHVREHVELLPPRQRDVVWRHLVEGLTFRELAKVTGLSKSVLHREYDAALVALRASLGEYYYGGRTAPGGK